MKELIEQFEKAAREWRDASEANENTQRDDIKSVARNGLRLNKAQNSWYVLCSAENVMALCAAARNGGTT